jgi:hypothetical protein
MHSAAMWMKPSRPRQKRIEKAGPGAAGTLGRCRTAESFCTQSAGCRRSLNFETVRIFLFSVKRRTFFSAFPCPRRGPVSAVFSSRKYFRIRKPFRAILNMVHIASK